MIFTENDYVEYLSPSGRHEGYIRFVSEYYVTLCIATYQKSEEDTCCFSRTNEVCIVIYPQDWDKINLLNTK